jgi:hypothetical protein
VTINQLSNWCYICSNEFHEGIHASHSPKITWLGDPPPLSKHTPLPTRATNGRSPLLLLLLLLLVDGCQVMSITTGGLAAALPTVCTAGQLSASSWSPSTTDRLAPAGRHTQTEDQQTRQQDWSCKEWHRQPVVCTTGQFSASSWSPSTTDSFAPAGTQTGRSLFRSLVSKLGAAGVAQTGPRVHSRPVVS